MTHISSSNVVSGLLEEVWIRGLSVEHISSLPSINVSPKWRHQSTITVERKCIWCVL